MGGNLPSARIFTTIGLLALSGVIVAARQSKTPIPYTIGPDDVVSVNLFDQDPRYSGDFTVRPDGKITLLLVDDIQAGGRTPLELKGDLTKAYAKYFDTPVVLVRAKEIRSWKVYISGEVPRSGQYPLNDSINILQLIAVAGGLNAWADKKTSCSFEMSRCPTVRPTGSFSITTTC